MKLSEQILRKPFHVAFGQAMAGGGITSVDLVAVRDATTVTMTASDGSAAPIAGADASTAGVMTAVDKSKLDSLPTATARDFTTKLDVATSTIGAGIAHLRTAGYAAAGDGGGALYTRVGAQPAHNLKVQSADSAWWELVPDHGYINVKQAGAKGDNVTNDGQAFKDCLAFAALSVLVNNATTYGVIVPPSDDFYYLGANTLELKTTVHLVGQDIGTFGGNACTLRWDANITGIIVHRHDTIGATTEADSTTYAGQGSRIEGLRLYSDGGTIAAITDGTKGHGVWLRGRASLIGMTITRFPGNGVNIVATVAGGASTKGNANGWIIDEALITMCHQNGVFVDMGDTNVGLATSVDCNDNGRWGFYDSGFLGSTYIACHASGNGLATKGENGAGESSYVHLGGRLYSANVAASEAGLVATTPGTDETVWYDLKAGSSSGTVPNWLAAQPSGTYFHGGPYRTDDINARHIFMGCYTEGGQGAAQYVKPTLVYGGFIVDVRGNAVVHDSDKITGTLKFQNDQVFTTTRTQQLMINGLKDKQLNLQIGGDHTSGMNIVAWDEASGQVLIGEHANSGARRPIRLTTNLNTQKYGRATALVGGEVAFERGIFVGAAFNARHMSNATAVPSSSDHAKGEIYWNSSASAGAVLGWVCVTAGAPGTWVEIRGVANQTTGANQAALTNSSGGTRDGTIAAVGDTSTTDQSATINSNLTELHTLLDEVRTTLVNFGLMKGSA